MAKAHFPAVVDLSFVGTPNFQAQMLTWAVSGAPFLAAGAGDISVGYKLIVYALPSYIMSQVILVDDHDPLYLGGRTSAAAAAYVASGTISFRTCLLEARIPASYLLRVAQASYTSPEPRTRRHYIHHWLLAQSLNGIASHSFS